MRGIKITRETFLQGLRKVGLDSGMLIRLIDNPALFASYHLQIDEEEGLLFTHAICIEETQTVLTLDFGYEQSKAKEAVERFIKEHHIEIIPRDRGNSDIVGWMFRECKKSGIVFHPPDCFIIADFYKNKINKVYSGNNHFLEACNLFGMDTQKLKTEDKQIQDQLRELIKHRRREALVPRRHELSSKPSSSAPHATSSLHLQRVALTLQEP